MRNICYIFYKDFRGSNILEKANFKKYWKNKSRLRKLMYKILKKKKLNANKILRFN